MGVSDWQGMVISGRQLGSWCSGGERVSKGNQAAYHFVARQWANLAFGVITMHSFLSLYPNLKKEKLGFKEEQQQKAWVKSIHKCRLICKCGSRTSCSLAMEHEVVRECIFFFFKGDCMLGTCSFPSVSRRAFFSFYKGMIRSINSEFDMCSSYILFDSKVHVMLRVPSPPPCPQNNLFGSLPEITMVIWGTLQ